MARDDLRQYQQKRDFRKTSEPKGRGGGAKNIFVIQKHDASRLHYDFRLGMDGVLKSWAVPKGLSTAAGERRLAVRTEDHPMEYASFEGVIPEGEYGGGTVMVWDTGEYEPIVDDETEAASPAESLEGGALKFNLKGRKLEGGYALVRMKRRGRGDDGREQWLIFKLDDKYADARRNPASSEPDSALSGRSLKEIARDEDS